MNTDGLACRPDRFQRRRWLAREASAMHISAECSHVCGHGQGLQPRFAPGATLSRPTDIGCDNGCFPGSHRDTVVPRGKV